MNKIKLLGLFFLISAYGVADAQALATPRVPSPGSTLSQTIGISTVTINYSRPSVKGREVWGKLVPYGWNKQLNFGTGNSAPWRAGANENTTITLSHAGKIEGKDVPAGTYGLFFVINQDNSGEVVLSKDYQAWGSFFYDEKNDLMRAPIKVRDNGHTEMLTYDFMNLTKTTGELVLNWEKKQFPVKIEFDVDGLVIANAKDKLNGSTGFDVHNWITAANYSLQNKVDLDQGLKWADVAVNRDPRFPSSNLKANILDAMGKSDDAEKIRSQALATATEADVNNYGYQLLNQKKFDKAIEVLSANTKNFPKSPNVWDSLGEAYALKGDKTNAIKNFKKSLSLNPPANVKANSEKFLKEYGAM